MAALRSHDTQPVPYREKTTTRILVIDDDASVTAAIQAILIRHRYETVIASRKREINGYPGAKLVLKKSEDPRELFVAMEKFCGFERENTVSILGCVGPASGAAVRSERPAVHRDAPIDPVRPV